MLLKIIISFVGGALTLDTSILVTFVFHCYKIAQTLGVSKEKEATPSPTP